MFYDKKIKYLDYCENGERISGGGFAKTEVKEKNFKLYLNVRGLRLGGIVAAKVILLGKKEIVLGQMTLEDGQGEFRHECQLQTEGLNCSYEDIAGIRVLLGENRELKCGWKKEAAAESRSNAKRFPAVEGLSEAGGRLGVKGRSEAEQSPAVESRSEAEGQPGVKGRSEAERSPAVEGRSEAEGQPGVKGLSKAERSPAVKGLSEAEGQPGVKGLSKAERSPAVENRSGAEGQPAVKGSLKGQNTSAAEDQSKTEQSSVGEKQAVKTIPLLEDKWRQISAIYPHVRPFQDERDYLSIEPADFVMFTAASYRAANNSFLLHGYYNYKHLILTRVEQRGEILYYLGVPGNYYAREKQVAVIFGFESFECAEEPAQDGDFGYYLMRVQL